MGNLALDPRAGLLFVEFNQGDLLYLATTAEIVWDGDELASFTGAERLLRFTVHEVLHISGSLALSWGAAVAPSPFVANTGAWWATLQARGSANTASASRTRSRTTSAAGLMS